MKIMNMLRQPYLNEFEGGGGEPASEPELELELDDPEIDLDTDPEPEPTPPAPIKVKYNHDEIEIPYEEAVQYVQKGMNYDKAVERAARDAEAKEQLANMLFETGFKGEPNPYTGRPIETIEDWITWKEENERQALQQAGFSPDYIEQIINNHPAIKQANAMMEHSKVMQQQVAFNRELAEIQKINPKIRSIDDLVAENSENEAFNALVRGGMSLSKAYATVNRIPQKKQDDTKAHLQSVGGGVGGDASEPSKDVMQEYLNMGFTKDEAVKHWRKEHKNG